MIRQMLKVSVFCLFLSLTSMTAIAQPQCSSEKNKKITAYISYNIGYNQYWSKIKIAFDNGPAVKFRLNLSMTQQMQKITLPACDSYQYTVTGSTLYFQKVGNKITDMEVPTNSDGQQTIRIMDGDRLILTGNLYDFKAAEHKVFLQLDAHAPQMPL